MSSLLNFGTILQRAFDSTAGALKITSSDMSIELSANDGDSVLTQRQTIQVAVTAGEVVNVSKYSKITYLHAVNANTATKILLLDNVTEINGPTLTTGTAADICAVNLKIVSAGEIVLQA